jgi:hypothetical protein
MTYKLMNSEGGQSIRLTTKTGYIHIPKNPENADYQKYLEWLEIDGNEPEAAD